MNETKTIMAIHSLAVDSLSTSPNGAHTKAMEKVIKTCEGSEYFFRTDYNEDGTLNFDFVDSEWITQQLEHFGVRKNEFAAGVNVESAQISNWLSGNRNPSGAAQAAIWYYFRSLIDK